MKQNCLSAEDRPHMYIYLCSCDLDLDPVTLILDFQRDIMKTYLCTASEVCRSQHLRVRARTQQTGQTDTQTDATENITMPRCRW